MKKILTILLFVIIVIILSPFIIIYSLGSIGIGYFEGLIDEVEK